MVRSDHITKIFFRTRNKSGQVRKNNKYKCEKYIVREERGRNFRVTIQEDVKGWTVRVMFIRAERVLDHIVN